MMHEVAILVLFGLNLALIGATTVDVPELGQLQGTTTLTQWTLQQVFEFRAIPYAKPPILDKRFKYSEKFGGWTGVRNATQYGQACPQPGLSANRASLYGQFISNDEETLERRAVTNPEDCLTLDVYTKSIGAGVKRPVFVNLHGGFFLQGMSSSLKPGYLLENDIVLVVPQYRLGPFGFMYLESEEVPGNMGLMDQIVALEWVRDHIAAFGGDPNKVTLGGNSAGGASTSLLMFNERAQRLFHQVIPQSGPSLSFWALDKTDGTAPSKELAAVAGCESNLPPNLLFNCLRSKTATELVTAYLIYGSSVWMKGELGMKSSIPVLQSRLVANRILVNDPLDDLESGNYPAKPALVTVVKHEGILTMDLIYQLYLTPNNLVNNETYLKEDLIPDYLKVYGINDYTKVFSDSLMKQYFDPEVLGDFTKMTPSLIDVTGVLSHKGPSYKQAHAHALKENTYLMSLDYHGQYTVHSNSSTSLPVPGGITHADELIYLYPRAGMPLNEEDTKIAKLMVKIFGNFIISGNPSSTPLEGVPEWKPLQGSSDRHMLSVRNEKHQLIEDYRDVYNTAREEGLVWPNAAPAALRGAFFLQCAAALIVLVKLC